MIVNFPALPTPKQKQRSSLQLYLFTHKVRQN